MAGILCRADRRPILVWMLDNDRWPVVISYWLLEKSSYLDRVIFLFATLAFAWDVIFFYRKFLNFFNYVVTLFAR